jgi:hypothetical protein
MDFLAKLPKTPRGNTAVYIVVDRNSKMAHFIATADEANAERTAHLFEDHVFKLHGMPGSITSDQDSKFMSHF